MPRPKTIDKLPAVVRQELIGKIINNGFAGYQEAAAWLGNLGYPASKSVLHKFGQELKGRREQMLDDEIAARQHLATASADLRMRCIEAAVAAGESDVLGTAQNYFEWVNLQAD